MFDASKQAIGAGAAHAANLAIAILLVKVSVGKTDADQVCNKSNLVMVIFTKERFKYLVCILLCQFHNGYDIWSTR